MRFGKRSQPLPIGIDLGRDSVKLLQVEAVGDRLSVVDAARAPLPEHADGDLRSYFAEAMPIIRRLRKQSDFAGDRAVVALPRELLWTRNFRVPMPEPRDLERVVMAAAAKLAPYPEALCQLNVLIAGQSRQGNAQQVEAIAMAAHRDEIAHFIEQTGPSGCALSSIDIETNALYRSAERFVRRKADEQDVIALVDIGRRATQVVIGRGRELSFSKTIDVGGAQIESRVAEKLGLSNEDARLLRQRLNADAARGDDPIRRAAFDATRVVVQELAQELTLFLRYYQVTFRGRRPRVVRLVGGESRDAAVCKVLDDALALPVRASNPLAALDTRRLSEIDRLNFGGEWAVALGLALRTTDRYFGAVDGERRDTIGVTEPEPLPETSTPMTVDPENTSDAERQHERPQSEGRAA